jgi:hypothetical protein
VDKNVYFVTKLTENQKTSAYPKLSPQSYQQILWVISIVAGTITQVADK